MGRLIICGNGFDLYHGLPTNWMNYYEYLKSSEKTAPLDQISGLGESFLGGDRNVLSGKDAFWSDVESNLNFDFEGIIIERESEIRPGSDDTASYHALEIFVDSDTDRIGLFTTKHAVEWINSIDLSTIKRKLQFTETDIFVTFNYTKTLEMAYGIASNRILHIHGTTESGIQFGNPSISPENVVHELTKTFIREEYSDVAYNSAIDVLKRLARNTLKNISENYDTLKHFLNGKAIDEVVIMGHNFCGVDFPYYKDIFFQRYEDKKWRIYCHKQSNRDTAQAFFRDQFGDKYEKKCTFPSWPTSLDSFMS